MPGRFVGSGQASPSLRQIRHDFLDLRVRGRRCQARALGCPFPKVLRSFRCGFLHCRTDNADPTREFRQNGDFGKCGAGPIRPLHGHPSSHEHRQHDPQDCHPHAQSHQHSRWQVPLLRLVAAFVAEAGGVKRHALLAYAGTGTSVAPYLGSAHSW